jgi:hypothetical protein
MSRPAGTAYHQPLGTLLAARPQPGGGRPTGGWGGPKGGCHPPGGGCPVGWSVERSVVGGGQGGNRSRIGIPHGGSPGGAGPGGGDPGGGGPDEARSVGGGSPAGGGQGRAPPGGGADGSWGCTGEILADFPVWVSGT